MSEKKIKKGSMELPISSEELILAVQNRPFLYDSNLDDFNDKRKKLAAWLEICEEVIPNWSKIRSENSEACSFIEFELQKKWRNLRDCFTRAYKKQASAKAHGKKPPRPYVYYELLSFLLPLVSKRYSASGKKLTSIHNDTDDDSDGVEYLNDEQLEISENGEDIKSEFHEILMENDILPDEDAVSTKPEEITSKNVNIKLKRNLSRKRILATPQSIKSQPEHKKIRLNDNINNLVENMNRQSMDSVKDPDEMFLLGLLPHLKKIKEDKRLEVQIEIMQLLKNRIHEQEYD